MSEVSAAPVRTLSHNLPDRRSKPTVGCLWRALACVLAAAALPAPLHAQEGYGWTPGFGIAGLNGSLRDSLVWDDGSGPALYVGGTFAVAGDEAAQWVARWDGATWSALGDPVTFQPFPNESVHALCVWDDGSGDALYVAGQFTRIGSIECRGLASWDGAVWTPAVTDLEAPGGGTGRIEALRVFDAGDGPALYAAGYFARINGVLANHVARYQNGAWSAIGSTATTTGSSQGIHAIEVFDDGAGPELYIAGEFTMPSPVFATRIAKWNGVVWDRLASGIAGGSNPAVHAMQVYDAGEGPQLFVGGRFATAGGVSVSNLARWSGGEWTGVAGGVSGGSISVTALRVWDDGTGPALHVGGTFTQAGGQEIRSLARWSGANWEAVAPGALTSALRLPVVDLGGQNRLLVGGTFTNQVADEPKGVALWSGAEWTLMGKNSEPNASVSSLASRTEGATGALYVGGRFTKIGNLHARRVARWDGTNWSPLGPGLSGFPGGGTDNSNVATLSFHGPSPVEGLVAGGNFEFAGGAITPSIAVWNRRGWRTIGGGVTVSPIDGGLVRDTLTFDDGSGPALYAAGFFYSAGGQPVTNIARWDGRQWSPVGAMQGHGGGIGFALAAYDDGRGPALYLGGNFTKMDNANTRNLARWDGREWSSIGAVGLPHTHDVYDLLVHDDGSGPALYVAGDFNSIDGVPMRFVARYDGSGWSALGADSFVGTSVACLASLPEPGGGRALYAGGAFSAIGALPARNIARWDGREWTALGVGTNGTVSALVAHDEDGDGPGLPALFVGGVFNTTGPHAAVHLGRWGPAPR